MANIKSQIKRNRQNEKRRLRNRDFRGAARTAIKDAHIALEAGQATPASIMAAVSALDKAAQKGAIHPRNASRRKGRLMKRLTALQLPGLQSKAVMAEPAAPVMDKKEAEKKSAKAELLSPQGQEPKPAKEARPKAAAGKKPTAKKTAEKKPAARKSTAKK